MERSGSGFPVLEAAKINLKHNTSFSIAVSAALLVLVPFIVGTANLDRQTSAVPLEMFVSLIGIVLLTPVFSPEQNRELDDLVSSKYISTTRIYLIRTACSVLASALLIGLFSVYMGIQNCDVTPLLAAGTLSDAIFLGSLGMFTSAVCGSTVVGYMPPIFFYMLNYGMGSKLKAFYLFSMTVGKYAPKIWMLAAGVLLMGAALLLRGRRKR